MNGVKTALITGASKGIGRQMALSLCEKGYQVAIVARNLDDLTEVQSGAVHKQSILPIECDIRDAEACEDIVNRVQSKWGGIDILINNASAMWWKPYEKTPIEKFDVMHEVNVRATYQLTRLCLPHMCQQGWGHVITHSPPFTPYTVGRLVHDGWLQDRVAYMSSKLGMSIVSAGFAEEVKGSGVAVNTIWPSTPIMSEAVRHHKLGDVSMWRHPSIMSDMLLHMLEEDPDIFSGNSLVDQTYLESKGVSDFTTYQCVPGIEPSSLDSLLSQFRKLEKGGGK